LHFESNCDALVNKIPSFQKTDKWHSILDGLLFNDFTLGLPVQNSNKGPNKMSGSDFGIRTKKIKSFILFFGGEGKAFIVMAVSESLVHFCSLIDLLVLVCS
jgi:hypothetical protein